MQIRKKKKKLRLFLFVQIFFLFPTATHAHERAIFNCSDLVETTIGMTQCADRNIRASDQILKKRLTKENFYKWKETRSEVCNDAYGWKPEFGGTIHPVVLLRCNESLNDALIEGSESLGKIRTWD